MIIRTFGATLYGVNASLITIEVSITQGVGISFIGLHDNAAREIFQRIEAALNNSGYQLGRQKAIINLSSTDAWQESAVYDLPIALCILSAAGIGNFRKELSEYVILGEFNSEGQLIPMKGVLPIAIEARKRHLKGFIIPVENALEASIVSNLDVFGVSTLLEGVRFLQETQYIRPTLTDTRDIFFSTQNDFDINLSEEKSYGNIERAMEIAVAGGHNIIIVGELGRKTVLAEYLLSILPPLTLQEALETTKIHSVAGKLKAGSTLISRRPYRIPHHSIEVAALIGYDSLTQPGEISLAHNGVLFLTEVTEFKQHVLEALLQPLKERKVIIKHNEQTAEFLASFMLVVSMASCPCGYHNQLGRECVCGQDVVQDYIDSVSSSLLKVIDIRVGITPANVEGISSTHRRESPLQIRQRVVRAYKRQMERLSNWSTIYNNAGIPDGIVDELCIISVAGRVLLKRSINHLDLSKDAYNSILKISRTIADLDDSDDIRIEHLAEAIQQRVLGSSNVSYKNRHLK